jgi:hypothetical protein
MNYKAIHITNVKNQKEAIMWHLMTYKQITSWEAIKEYGATRLSAIIFNLRNEGYNIISIDTSVTNRFGKQVNIATYKYIPPIVKPIQQSLFTNI